MTIIEAPNEIYSVETNSCKKLFLAGGITNCPDWQSLIIAKLRDVKSCNLVVYNPRRANFPINDPNASDEQITWEFNHLRDADQIIFWFASGSLNPIVLYELGKWGNSSNVPMCIYIDPEYERKNDVIMQTKLARDNVTIFTPKSMDEGVDMIVDWICLNNKKIF